MAGLAKNSDVEHITEDAQHIAKPSPSMCVCMMAVCFALTLASGRAAAGEPRWPEGTYKYITVDQSVHDALVEFGRNIGVPVKIGTTVKGRLNAGMPVGSAREFLEWVSGRYGLVWHFDGSAINIATQAEVLTEVVKLDAGTTAEATDRLDRLGVRDSRFSLTISEVDDAVTISGPPSYIALVKKTLGVPTAQPVGAKKLVAVRVFRGLQAEVHDVPASKAGK
jgi:type III secretion protein C